MYKCAADCERVFIIRRTLHSGYLTTFSKAERKHLHTQAHAQGAFSASVGAPPHRRICISRTFIGPLAAMSFMAKVKEVKLQAERETKATPTETPKRARGEHQGEAPKPEDLPSDDGNGKRNGDEHDVHRVGCCSPGRVLMSWTPKSGLQSCNLASALKRQDARLVNEFGWGQALQHVFFVISVELLRSFHLVLSHLL
jgi:hypothetical protein